MMKINLSICLILSLFLLCSGALAQMESYSDIQVISSDENGITFNYLVPELRTRKLNLDEGSFDLVDIEKCATLQESGNPRLPLKIIALGVPLGSEVEVEVLDVATTKRVLNIAPVPILEKDQTDKLGYKYRYAPAPKVYAKSTFFPERIFAVEPAIFVRNQRVVKLLIFPIQFNPQIKSAQVHKNITIRVNFIGGEKGKVKAVGRDLFENIYKKTLLNYEQAKNWRRPEVKRELFKPKQPPFDYSNKWYKIKIAEDGIYCLTKTDLSNAGITGNININEIRIFNGGGRALPLSNDSAYLELKEIPLWIKNNNGNQFFDSGDSLFFYGWSCSGWDYDSIKKEFVYNSHPYDSLNIFWLNCEGGFPDPAKRMNEKDGNPQTDLPISTYKFKNREHIEYNSDAGILKIDDLGHITNYHIWYWYKQSHISQGRFLPDLVVGDTNKINIKASSSVSSLSINGYLADIIGTESGEEDIVSKFQSDDFTDATLQALDINFSSTVYFDWYEIEYWRWLKFWNNYLFFESPDTEGVVEYNISNANDTLIFDISNRFEVKRISGAKLNGNTIEFQDIVAPDEKLQYYALEPSRIKKPSGIYFDEYSNWKEISHQADMVIITPEIFYEQVGSLADFRTTYNQFSVATVKLQDIYDEFSGGLTDPLAIRNFLKYTFNNWSEPPAFVLLAGDGHYDHKNYMKTGVPIRIPCFTAFSTSLDRPVSDEYYVYFGNYGDLDPDSSGEVDMVISRLPVDSNDELETVLEKVIDYEEAPSFGPWRNNITLVADDEFSGANNRTDIDHTIHSEDLANSYIPRVFDISKIYLMEYPFNSVGEKPGVNQAIIDAFDQGTLMINWIGHGNPDLWAHEHVFTKRDVTQLRVSDKVPLVFAATCEVGYFMDPTKQSLGEELFNTANKGAGAVIAASSLVTPDGNWELNRLFYEIILSSDRPFLGEALFSAKFLCTRNRDDRAYVLFGDPAAKLGSPRLVVSMQVNPDTLSALSLVSISGQVVDSLGSFKSDFNGTVNISAFDSKREKSHEVAGDGVVNYKLPGRTLFKGTTQVQNGNFQVQFVVPKDISYGGNTARISAYVYDQAVDGAGSIENLAVCGSDTTVMDEEGPKIEIDFLGQEKFKEGDFIIPNAVMQLTISDTNGVNLTGELGHGITLAIDDNPGETDLTHLFQYNAGSYTTGLLSYQLPALSEGEHLFKVKAWDSANNSTLLATKVKVKSSSKFEILNFMNYPNPFSKQTNFSYELTDDAGDVEIKIFTLAGRIIKTIYNCSNTVGYNFRTIWNGEDEDGDKVANGVYICKIEATSVHGIKAEAYVKAIVMH